VLVIDESNQATDSPQPDPVDGMHSAGGDGASAPIPPDSPDGPAGQEPTADSVEEASRDEASVNEASVNGSHQEETVNEETAAAEEPVASSSGNGAPDELRGQNKDWYILKVQSNREDSIRDGLLRRVKIHGLEDFFGEVIVPTELVTEFKNGKKKVSRRKLYPGYLMVNMEINEETWFLVRETPGIGDFTGSAGKPSPMLPHEVSKILAKQEEKTDESPKLKIAFNTGDRVKINEGTFANFEGDVDSIDEANGRVTVMINIFGRSTPVELEYWQVESID
jgi:transcriptional antiterminator NusG